MNEAEWLACTDPTLMLEFLRNQATDRELRLFGCACCRTVWSSIPAVFQEAIRVAEQHADGRATDVELAVAVSAAHRGRRKKNTLERAAYDAARSRGDAAGVAQSIAWAVAAEAAPNPSPTHVSRVVHGRAVTEKIPPDAARLLWNASFVSQLRIESSILRCIFGPLPFRSIVIDPVWLTPNVVALAQTIHDERVDRLLELADALMDAGCDNQEIPNHCRSEGPHVRGCWVVDLLLGKERSTSRRIFWKEAAAQAKRLAIDFMQQQDTNGWDWSCDSVAPYPWYPQESGRKVATQWIVLVNYIKNDGSTFESGQVIKVNIEDSSVEWFNDSP